MCWREKAKSALKREKIANVLQHLNVVKAVQNKLTYLKEERGAIFVLTALLLPIMFGCLGIAYDVGNVYIHKARLQNVTDAAALAGGRAYLESQTKTNENDRDAVDGTMDYRSKEIADCTYKSGRTMSVKYEYGADTTIDRGNTTQHPDADLAADKYIYKNLANLGNTVYADKYSHFALNYGSADSRIFYRIGLYETVPLRFLPVITDKYSETVRAGAIALVEPGTTEIIHGGGSSSSTVTHPSIFDNLYTYSEAFDSGVSNEQGHTLHATYTGNMVFTYGNGSPNTYYDMNLGTTKFAEHLFSDSTVDLEGIRNNTDNNEEWNKVNDPIINTYFNTEAYINAFKSWLNEPHIEITSQNKNGLTSSEINDPNSDLYLTAVTVDGHPVRVHNNNFYYIYMGNNDVYYAFDVTTKSYTYLNGSEQTEDNRIRYLKYNGGNNFVRCVKRDDKYYVVNSNGDLTDSYIQNGTMYGQAYNSFDGNAFDQNDQAYKARIETNIIHFNNTCTLNITISDTIKKVFDSDTDSTPIYVIIENTVNLQNINCPSQDFGRPLIIVYLGTSEIRLQNGNFNGVVYAPYASNIYVNSISNFNGNIITKKITIQPSGGMGTWVQKNYLENDDYNDEHVAEVTQTIKENIENATKLPDDVKNDIYSQYASVLGIEPSDMQADNWYSKQSYANKQKLYGKWKELYANAQYQEYANQLWPWNEHFDIESGEDQIITTGDNLRLINFRTEFRENGDPDATVDPFIYVTLGNPLAY